MDFDRAERRSFRVEEADAGARLDRFLALRLEEFSRAALQRLIRRGAVEVNGAPARPAGRVHVGDRVEVTVPALLPATVEPEDLPLRVLREEESFVVLDKDPGIAVHPGRGRSCGTLANAVAYHYGGASIRGGAHRPGIVHRLDIGTSGVIVIALTEPAHAALADAFKERTVFKRYEALLFGEPAYDEDRIDLPLGRAVNDPLRRAVRFDVGRPSITEVDVLERFGSAAHVLCRPLTGRTHQIRVHLAARGTPLLGDTTYARRRKPPVDVPRLMLHAARLDFPHPVTGDRIVVEAPLPDDFAGVLASLRQL